MRDGKWIYEAYGEEIWSTCYDEFDTREEAIEAGREYFQEEAQNGDYDHEKFSVGQISKVSFYVCPDHVIDNAIESAYDQAGEVTDGWLDRIKTDDLNKLGDMLTEVFYKWLDQTNNKPHFFTMENTEDVHLEVE